MRSETAPAIRLEDYHPPAYRIDTVHLNIDLDPTATRVTATLKVNRQPGMPAGTPLILDGDELTEGADFTVDTATGVIGFAMAPAAGAALTAGFAFDTPVRFDAERLEVSVEAFQAGRPLSIPLVEIRV